ncbi:arylesterase [Portibacter marinus]|uniref:arylesterase n=1 Tax=Portibacter marinus TaxID=2898660 RepID=UPI001F2B88AF|nr:arylesterase [Portibacter marinus]
MKYYLLSLLLLLSLQACKDKPNNDVKVGDNETNVQTLSTNQQNSGKKRIMFFGNSLTAGYGLEEGQDFPSLIQNKLDSLGLEYEVINAGLSGETTSNGLERINWVLREPVDIFVLELGANDMLRGTSVESTEQNLRAILDIVQEKSPDAEIIIAGMQAAPNMGEDYVDVFNDIYPRLANDYNAELIPFFLKDVAGVESLNLPDRKHPNVEGQKIVASNVWEVLEPMVQD